MISKKWFSSGRERGSAMIMVLLVLVLLATSVTLVMFSTTTAALVAGRDSEVGERAYWNLMSTFEIVGPRISADLQAAVLEAVQADNARKGSVDFTRPRLVGAEFAPLAYDISIPGPGNTADDRAHVDVAVSLVAPPTTLTPQGLSTTAKVFREDRYTFRCRATAEAFSTGGGRRAGGQDIYLYVSLMLGTGPSTTKTWTIAGIDAGDGPSGFSPLAPKPDFWNLTPSAYAASSASVALAEVSGYGPNPQGSPDDRGWQGPYQEVTGPGHSGVAGYPHGNQVRWFHYRGVAPGTVIPGREVIATDNWRFDPYYKQAHDGFPYTGVDGNTYYTKGSPEYALVIERMPLAHMSAQPSPDPDRPWLGLSVQATHPTLETAIEVAASPLGIFQTKPFVAAMTTGPGHVQNAAKQLWTIPVPGAGTTGGVTGGDDSSSPLGIVVRGWTGDYEATEGRYTRNSNHSIDSAEPGAEETPAPPLPGCPTCDPPGGEYGVRGIAMYVVPMTIWFTPDDVPTPRTR